MKLLLYIKIGEKSFILILLELYIIATFVDGWFFIFKGRPYQEMFGGSYVNPHVILSLTTLTKTKPPCNKALLHILHWK